PGGCPTRHARYAPCVRWLRIGYSAVLGSRQHPAESPWNPPRPRSNQHSGGRHLARSAPASSLVTDGVAQSIAVMLRSYVWRLYGVTSTMWRPLCDVHYVASTM